MGWFDNLFGRLRGEADARVAEAATTAAASAAEKAVSGLAEGFLASAEAELAEARKARGLDETDGEATVDPTMAPTEPCVPLPTAKERREAAEARAREELARLKAAREAEDQQPS